MATDTETTSTERYIRTVMRNVYGREIENLRPFSGGKNSTVYSFEAGAAARDAPTPTGRHAVSPLPASSTQLVIRVANPEAMLNEAVRAQSEVAMMMLMRQALMALDENIVPVVYGWDPPGEAKGWLLMELMSGKGLADDFPSLGSEKKADIVDQIARVVKAIQDFELPPSVKGFGGLNFDGEGNIITGATPIHGGGPCDTLAELYTEYFHTQVSFADKCDIVKGRREGGLRERLDKFAAEKLPRLLQELPLTPRPTLVHADFDLHNLLFDPSTNKLTGLVDFDFGHVASQADEYFYSFASLMHIIVPPTIDDPDMASLRLALLNGLPQGQEPKQGGEVDWALAGMVDNAFQNVGVKRPSEMPGIDELSALYWFIQDISPPMFFLKRWRSRAKPETMEMIRASTHASLEKNLSSWGY